MTWRKVTYYFSDNPVWVLEGTNEPDAAARVAPRLWQGNRAVEARQPGDLAPLRLPARGRLAWLLHPNSPFPAELSAQGVPMRKFGTKYLTDLAAAPERFRAGPFVFYRAAAATLTPSTRKR